MLIGVISDTHDNLPMIRNALAEFDRRGVEVILHGGDYVAPFAAKMFRHPDLAEGIDVHCIYGNNDGEREGLAKALPQIQDGPLRLKLADRVIVMHHALEWLSDEDVAGADVVIGGHTHEIVKQRDDSGRLTLNPGECCGYLSGKATIAVLNTETLSAEIIELS